MSEHRMANKLMDAEPLVGRFLYEKIKQQILVDIESGKYQPNELIPHEKQLCEAFDVSLITVRRALDELAKEGIISKVKGKGSVVAEAKKSVLSDKITMANTQQSVGVLMIEINQGSYPIRLDYTNNWSSKIVYGIKRAIGNNDFFIAGLPGQQLLERFHLLPFSNIERIVLLGGWNAEIVKFCLDQGKQVILYNNFEEGLKVPTVNNNERESCYNAIKHLIDQGHRKIAVINGTYDYSESRERYFGFKEAMFEHEMDIIPYFVKWGDYTPESGYYLMKELLEGQSRPTAIFCANDTVAAGAFLAIEEAGLKCPEEISLFGHDNLDFSINLGPGLSTIDPNYNEIGYQIGKLLIAESLTAQTITVNNEMIIRGSISDLHII